MLPDKKSVNGGVPEAVLFLPRPPASVGPDADRPAAMPMLARGLYLLHARYGHRPFETLVVPAERFARFGVPVSRALATDLAVVAGPLLADPGARAMFSRNGEPLREGDPLRAARSGRDAVADPRDRGGRSLPGHAGAAVGTAVAAGRRTAG